MKSIIGIALMAAFVSSLAFLRFEVAAQSVPQSKRLTATPIPGQTVGERFKNIQVFTDKKDAPASELYNTMQFMSGSLSASCNYCHVSQQGPFESDAKRTKLVARDMIKMVRAINQANFDGRPEVTCNTCHRGSARPNGTPVPWYKTPEEIVAYNRSMQPITANTLATGRSESPTPSTAGLPDADQVVANYRKAVGGSVLKSIRITGTNEVALSGNVTFEAYALFPDKILVTTINRGAESQTILNGDRGWRLTPQSKNPIPREGLGDIRSRLEYILLPVKAEKSETPRKMKGVEKIGDRSYYVLESHGNKSEQLYFDVQSGLLYKVRTETATWLGARIEEKTFEDYRDLNGMKLPYLITNHYMEDQSQFKISEIRINLDVDPAKFEPPASKP